MAKHTHEPSSVRTPYRPSLCGHPAVFPGLAGPHFAQTAPLPRLGRGASGPGEAEDEAGLGPAGTPQAGRCRFPASRPGFWASAWAPGATPHLGGTTPCQPWGASPCGSSGEAQNLQHELRNPVAFCDPEATGLGCRAAAGCLGRAPFVCAPFEQDWGEGGRVCLCGHLGEGYRKWGVSGPPVSPGVWGIVCFRLFWVLGCFCAGGTGSAASVSEWSGRGHCKSVSVSGTRGAGLGAGQSGNPCVFQCVGASEGHLSSGPAVPARPFRGSERREPVVTGVALLSVFLPAFLCVFLSLFLFFLVFPLFSIVGVHS